MQNVESFWHSLPDYIKWKKFLSKLKLPAENDTDIALIAIHIHVIHVLFYDTNRFILSPFIFKLATSLIYDCSNS